MQYLDRIEAIEMKTLLKFEILFSLKGPFGGQKESFKTILGFILSLFCCYYSSKRIEFVNDNEEYIAII